MSLYAKPFFRLVTTLLVAFCASMQALAQGTPAHTTLANLSSPGTLIDPLETAIYDPDFTEYLTWLDAEINTLGVPGVAMAVVSSTDTLDLRTWGVRSAGEDAPVDADTLFRIASVSKTFAGAVTAKLVHDRKQSWDTPIVSILPQYSIGTQDSSREMTLRHVLSHSTGLMPHAYSNMLDSGVAYEKIQEKFREIPTVCPPGRCYGYQNVVFSLVSDVVEVSEHESYEQYVQEVVLAPMGISDMQISKDGNGARVPGEVSYYSNWQPPQNLNVTRMDAHGGWLASAYHLALLAAQTDGGTNFPDLLPPGTGLDYLSTGVWQHNGALPGTTALLRVSSGLSYVVLMNRGEENFQEVIQYISNFMNQKTLNRTLWPQVDYFRQL